MILTPDLVAELLAAGIPERRTGCWETGCRRRHHARGLCDLHYSQRYRPRRSTNKPYVRRGPKVWRPDREMDPDMIQRVISEPVPADEVTLDEARCAAWILTQQGRSANWIADRLHIAPRTVTRWRVGWRNALNEQPGQQEMHQVSEDEAA